MIEEVIGTQSRKGLILMGDWMLNNEPRRDKAREIQLGGYLRELEIRGRSD